MANSPQRPDSSKSRSRSREPVHTTGRGGAGNMYLGGPSEKDIEEQDESERSSHAHEPGMYVSLTSDPSYTIPSLRRLFFLFQAFGRPWRLWQSQCRRVAVLQGRCEPARQKSPACDSLSPCRDRWPGWLRKCYHRGLTGFS